MYGTPAQKDKYSFEISDFKGVDFTTSPIEVDKRRSPDAVNVVNVDGYNEKRKGYDVLSTIGTNINGVWNIDTETDELFLVHSGTKLYQCSSDFTSSVVVLEGMADIKSKGIYINGYLVIFDGNRTVVFSKFDGANYEAKYLDTCGYIPTISIARDNNGGGTSYEGINLLSPYRINMFLASRIEGDLDADGNPTYTDQTTFKLAEQNVDEISYVRKLTNEGTWENVADYTYDLVKGEVYFIPGESPVLGRDNVQIKYKKSSSESADKINKCKIITLYGYEGNRNRVFATGNPDFANYDYWCEQENPLYWTDENFAKVGIEPIVDYGVLNDGTLGIYKKQSDTDYSIYYRTYSLLNSVEVFPLTKGSKNIGCVNSYANTTLLNDPLMLSNQGVFAVIGNNGEKFAQQRSYYVNGKLLKETNLENATGISVDGKYYLGINNHVYIADSRYLSYPKNSKTEQYQYEWYYLEGIPARVFFSWNDKLYFGTSDGKICTFGDTYQDNGTNYACHWETPFFDMGTNSQAKTIKQVNLVLNPKTNTDLTLSYELDDGEEDIITKEYYNLTDDFPKTITEKTRIRKFMFVKFKFKNETNTKLTFEKLSCEYVISGKYKGE